MDGNVRAMTREALAPCPGGCGAEITFQQYQIGDDRWHPTAPGRCETCRERQEREQREAEERAVRARREEEVRRRTEHVHDLLAQAGASPWEHGEATLDNFDTSEAGREPVGAARSFIEAVRSAGKYDPVPGLYFAGTTGSGKSHLATAIARELLLDPDFRTDSVIFDPADVLVSRIRSLYGGKGDVDAFLRKRESCRVWILDDLGREPPHPDVVGHLTMLIAQRAKRGTVITGNLLPEEYEQRHADLARIGSRLGPGYFRTVKVEGRDRRFDT